MLNSQPSLSCLTHTKSYCRSKKYFVLSSKGGTRFGVILSGQVCILSSHISAYYGHDDTGGSNAEPGKQVGGDVIQRAHYEQSVDKHLGKS